MEENKNKTEIQQNAQGQGGRKRRRHRRGGGNGGNNGNNGNNANAQSRPQNQQSQQNQQSSQNPQNRQNAQNQNGNKNQQKQSAPPNNGNGQGQSKKNKNRPAQQPQQKQNNPNNQQNNQNNKNGKNNAKQDENRPDTYLYSLDGNLYVNLTNKCCNGCHFCVRNERSSYYGNYLWIRHGDPTAEKVISQANGYGDLTRFKEVVFCGFGEPTYKMAEMLALCDYFHEKGLKTRLNTNGQGNLINKRDIVPELKGKIDFVNISLNASCYEKYQPICRSQFGESGFAGIIEFAKDCRKNGVDCRFSVVDCIGEDEVEACKRLAESIKVPLYVRKYIADS